MKKILITLLILAAIAVVIYFLIGFRQKGYVKISAEQAHQIMTSGEAYILLDVRTPEEYAERHIPGAVLIPDYELKSRAERELPDKDRLILVYCRSGNRSQKAANALLKMGYTNVKDFGGIIDWPFETERSS